MQKITALQTAPSHLPAAPLCGFIIAGFCRKYKKVERRKALHLLFAPCRAFLIRTGINHAISSVGLQAAPECLRRHALPAPFGGLTLQKGDSQYLETYAGYGVVYFTSYKRQGGSPFGQGLLFYLHNGGKTPGTDYRPSAKLSPQRGRVGRDAGGTPGLPGDLRWIRYGLSYFLQTARRLCFWAGPPFLSAQWR